MHCGYFDATRKGNRSTFLAPAVVGGRRPLPSKICAQSDPPTPFETRRLGQISAYNVPTARDSETSVMKNRKLTMGFPTSYRWRAYVTPTYPPKGGSKSDF